MSISIGPEQRSARPRHLAAGRFEQASLAILSRYNRLAVTADAAGREPEGWAPAAQTRLQEGSTSNSCMPSHP